MLLLEEILTVHECYKKIDANVFDGNLELREVMTVALLLLTLSSHQSLFRVLFLICCAKRVKDI